MSKLRVRTIEHPSGSGLILVSPGNTVVSPGSVIQVGRWDWTNETLTSGAAGWVDAANSSLTFTPKMANSKLIVLADLHLHFQYGANYAGGAARILRDGAVVSFQNDTHESYSSLGGATSADLYMRSAKSVSVPANATTATVFKMQISGYIATAIAHLNQGGKWQSSITIWEVAQ
jgi:hypothetical protein